MEQLDSVLQSVLNNSQVEEETKEALGIMSEMAHEKATLGDQNIMTDLTSGKTTDNIIVPISSVFQRKTEYLALTSTSPEDTIKDINLLMRGMISDNSGIVNGLSDIVNTALKNITCIGEGKQTDCRFYTVVMDYPMVVRLDFYLWGYNIKAQSLMSHLKTVLACVSYKSNVDISRLDYETFRSLYTPVLERTFGDDREKCMEMIKKSRELYSFYNS